MRQPVGNSRRQITDGQERARSKNWLSHVLEAKITLQNLNINTDRMQTDKPWDIKTRPPNNINISFASTNKAAAVLDQRRAATDAINKVEKTDYTIFTLENQSNGGAGLVVYNDRGVELDKIKGPAGAKANSFDAERAAFIMALQWLSGRRSVKATIISDSRALVTEIANWNYPSNHHRGRKIQIRDALLKTKDNGNVISVIWIPGHCNLPGNEAADGAAKEGTGYDQGQVPVERPTTKAELRRLYYNQNKLTHNVCKKVYSKRIDTSLESNMTVERQKDLARFRSSHNPATNYWLHKVGRSEDQKCRLCEDESENTEHLFKHCPALRTARIKILGTPDVELCALVTQPERSEVLVREILRRLKGQ